MGVIDANSGTKVKILMKNLKDINEVSRAKFLVETACIDSCNVDTNAQLQ